MVVVRVDQIAKDWESVVIVHRNQIELVAIPHWIALEYSKESKQL